MPEELSDEQLAAMFLRGIASGGGISELPQESLVQEAVSLIQPGCDLDIVSVVNAWQSCPDVSPVEYDEEQAQIIASELTCYNPSRFSFSAFRGAQLEDGVRRCLKLLTTARHPKGTVLRSKLLGPGSRIPDGTSILCRGKTGWRPAVTLSSSEGGIEEYTIRETPSGRVVEGVPWHSLRLDWSSRIASGHAGHLVILERQVDKLVSILETLPHDVRQVAVFLQARLNTQKRRAGKGCRAVSFAPPGKLCQEVWYIYINRGYPEDEWGAEDEHNPRHPRAIDRRKDLLRKFHVKWPSPQGLVARPIPSAAPSRTAGAAPRPAGSASEAHGAPRALPPAVAEGCDTRGNKKRTYSPDGSTPGMTEDDDFDGLNATDMFMTVV
eukprot:TRINITY_DN10126_c1_g1_i1.p1 TRINITY_DN10126_c1_g1~~TRINITY_DN10126_c1_g1_i1.p1  ORF type:complete len:381 (+),score=81.60 TRINITY_DN10126_c1_g1_i1:124-1266(+)